MGMFERGQVLFNLPLFPLADPFPDKLAAGGVTPGSTSQLIISACRLVRRTFMVATAMREIYLSAKNCQDLASSEPGRFVLGGQWSKHHLRVAEGRERGCGRLFSAAGLAVLSCRRQRAQPVITQTLNTCRDLLRLGKPPLSAIPGRIVGWTCLHAPR